MNLSAPAVARRLADALEAKQLEYGIGGALALGVWGFPRATKDLAVMKLLFFRAKDLIDVERLVAFGSTGFDRDYVERSLLDLVGGADARVARWKLLLADVDAQHS